jgi:hypothetical protein
MKAWLLNRVHLAFGRREWEIQATEKRAGSYLAAGLLWSGPPYLTKAEALAALPAWQRMDFIANAVAVNIRTGEHA